MRNIFLVFAFLFCNETVFSTTYETAQVGYWAEPSTWVAKSAPKDSSSDTFFIHHSVFLHSNTLLGNKGMMVIDSGAGICGHVIFNIETGAILKVKGFLETDSLWIHGGYVETSESALIQLSDEVIVTAGGQLKQKGGIIQTGYWFHCKEPWFSFMIPGGNFLEVKFKVFPNPAKNYLMIQNSDPEFRADITWEMFSKPGVLAQKGSLKAGEEKIDISGLSPGVYQLKVMDEKGEERSLPEITIF